MKRAKLRRPRGFTLVELLVAIGILAMISMLLYGAFASLRQSRDGIQRVNDRYREGRLAMARMSRELQSAYISAHKPIDLSLVVKETAFVGTRGSPTDRVDFNCFAHRRLDRDSHESDQAEISYFGSRDPERSGVTDLVRRVSSRLDERPGEGGRVDVMATDIDLFDVEYLDAMTGQWVETWDTTQALDEGNRLPAQIRIVLVLNRGARKSKGRGQDTIRFVTKIPVRMQRPLSFATR